jgi:hypothetical protein
MIGISTFLLLAIVSKLKVIKKYSEKHFNN